ncbi:caffeic acid 3-o-methyltransferase [Quercus suber]|uniref:Caffeic acid 3-o-methyltransferase n=1 Tax=Quercus suber TaxID=58331 RepID=A0AAW0IXC7_QUESU
MPLWLGCSVVADDFGSFQRLYSLSPVSKHFVRNEDGVSLGPLLALSQDEVFIKSWLYSLSPVSKHFVRNEDGVSLGPLLALSQDEVQLKGAILEGGIPFKREYGMHAFEYPDLDPMFNKVFNTAMFNHTTIVMKKILESYKGFEQLTQLVDIGGGLDTPISKALILTYHILYYMPHLIQVFLVSPSVEHIGGDMFESIPNGHAIFMKWILHDWSDEYCLKLLKNCYNAIPNDGKVIAVEAVLPTMPENSSSMKSTTHLDLIMMTQNPGGRERTQQEFMALATRAGFSGIRFGCCVSDIWVMEFFK